MVLICCVRETFCVLSELIAFGSISLTTIMIFKLFLEMFLFVFQGFEDGQLNVSVVRDRGIRMEETDIRKTGGEKVVRWAQ